RVREDGHHRRRRERAEDPERRDRERGAAEAPPADLHPPVEEDHDQRDDPDPLDVVDRDHRLETGEDIRGDGRGNEEERGRRDGEALGQLVRPERREEPEGDDEDDGPELVELAHARATLEKPLLPLVDGPGRPLYSFLTFRSTRAQRVIGYFASV